MTLITLMGKGYIGLEFYRQFYFETLINDRFDYLPATNKALITISTTDNYNVYEHPHLDIDTNLSVFITILENMRKAHGSDSDITFLSSWFCYGAQETTPVKEAAYCNPKGFYSITKRCAEQLLESYCNTFGMKYRILRLCNVIGGNDKKAGKKKNALQYMINELCAGRDIDLYDTPIYRDYLDVKDVIKAIRVAMSSPSGEIINIGSGKGHLIQDLIKYAHAEIQGTGQISRIETPEFHKSVQTDKMILDNTKITKMGFVPKYSVYDTIDEIIANAP